MLCVGQEWTSQYINAQVLTIKHVLGYSPAHHKLGYFSVYLPDCKWGIQCGYTKQDFKFITSKEIILLWLMILVKIVRRNLKETESKVFQSCFVTTFMNYSFTAIFIAIYFILASICLIICKTPLSTLQHSTYIYPVFNIYFIVACFLTSLAISFFLQ